MFKAIAAYFFFVSLAFACPPLADSRYHSLNSPILKNHQSPPKLIPEIEKSLNTVEAIYKDFLRPAGVNFKIRRYFASPTVAASPEREDSNWFVNVSGGMFDPAKMKYITPDYAAMVACHEVGHHLGGTIFYPEPYEWAAGEGQADYYATLKCLRRVFYEQKDSAKWLNEFTKKIELDADLKKEFTEANKLCGKAWSDKTEKIICLRSAMASFQLAENLKFKSSILTPSTDTARVTSFDYPSYQCRLDTMISGALCNVDYEIDIDLGSPEVGTCGANYSFGQRPKCWFVD